MSEKSNLTGNFSNIKKFVKFWIFQMGMLEIEKKIYK